MGDTPTLQRNFNLSIRVGILLQKLLNIEHYDSAIGCVLPLDRARVCGYMRGLSPRGFASWGTAPERSETIFQYLIVLLVRILFLDKGDFNILETSHWTLLIRYIIRNDTR